MALRALVIEDSLVFQKIMGEVLRSCEGIADVRVAGNGADGLAACVAQAPDVVFLDLHLPDMSGLDVLARLKASSPRAAVVVVSGAGGEGADLTVEAMSRGAQQFVCKPSGAGFQQSVDRLQAELRPIVQTVCQQKNGRAPVSGAKETAKAAPVPAPRREPRGAAPTAGFGITAVAVSTGGPEALARLVDGLPADYPTPIVVVQHMPPLFTASLAASLDARASIRVCEAQEGQALRAGVLYIAPGGRHMVVRGGVIRLNDDPPEQSVRPAADVLFRSLAAASSREAVLAVVMTGMGEDGLAGVRALKQGRCRCLTQSAATCVVYGMPRAVDMAGLSDESVPLGDLAARMTVLARGAAPVRS